MKRLIFCIMLSVVCIGSAFSQFDAQLSQYMFHNSAFNPAAVGENNMIQITGQHRIQWVGFPNAGQTTVFSVSSPLKFGNSENGIGFRFLNDRVGLFTNRSAQLQYAYKKRISGGLLSVGADLGFVSVGFHGDSVNVANHVINIGSYHDNLASDPAIPHTSVAGMGLDMSVGFFYSTPKYYGGLSFTHLNNPTINLDDKSNIDLLRTMYLTGGGLYTLTNPLYVLKPSALLKTDFRSLQLDVSARMEYDNKYWGGLSYRLQDAVVVLVGINLIGGLSIGYSYDLPTSKVITGSSGSHEIVLIYNFAYVWGKRTSKFKSIRIL